MAVLVEIKNLINFSTCAIYVLDSEMSQICEQITPELGQFFSSRLILDGGVHILGISLKEPVPMPKFKSKQDINYGFKTM